MNLSPKPGAKVQMHIQRHNARTVGCAERGGEARARHDARRRRCRATRSPRAEARATRL